MLMLEGYIPDWLHSVQSWDTLTDTKQCSTGSGPSSVVQVNSQLQFRVATTQGWGCRRWCTWWSRTKHLISYCLTPSSDLEDGRKVTVWCLIQTWRKEWRILSDALFRPGGRKEGYCLTPYSDLFNFNYNMHKQNRMYIKGAEQI